MSRKVRRSARPTLIARLGPTSYPIYLTSILVGGVITAQDFFWANVQPKLEISMSYEAFTSQDPVKSQLCESAATSCQQRFGALYVGQRDCVRSTMCDELKSQGRPELGGMCDCCHALNLNYVFRKRVERGGGEAAAAGSSSHVNHAHMTPNEKAAKLTARADDHDKQASNASRQEVTSGYRLAQAAARVEAALAAASAMMGELTATSDVLTETQRNQMRAETELAIKTQEAAETSAQLDTANQSLVSVALAEAAAREHLAAERAARLIAEEDASAAVNASEAASAAAIASEAAASKAAQTKLRLEGTLARAQGVHEAAVAAEIQARAKNISALEERHTAALEAERHNAATLVSRYSAELAVERERGAAELAAQSAAFTHHTAALEAERQCGAAELATLLGQQQTSSDREHEWQLETLMRDMQLREAQLVAAHAAEMQLLATASEQAQAQTKRTWQAQLKAEAALRAAETAALLSVIQNLMAAHKLGGLAKHQDTVGILDDIATCLRNGSTRGRELSPPTKQLYGLLLNNGSAWAHKFVSGVLFGPSLRTTQKARAAFDHGLVELGLTKQSLEALKNIHLVEHGLEDVPGIISEDASMAVRRLDFEELRTQTSPGVWTTGVKLWGFSGGTRTVHSVEELETLFKEGISLANYIYVYTWVPILPNSPWFPFAILATDNKFDNEWVFDRWRLMHESCAELELNLAGHISDGDSRLRKCDSRVNFATNSTADPRAWCSSTYFLKHSLLMLSLAYTKEGLCIFGFQDYMHLAWRCRVQLLSPKKEWEIGPGLRVGVAHLDSLRTQSGDKMLNGRDLDPHNKQHWPGVLKIFSKETAEELKRRIDAGEGHTTTPHTHTYHTSPWRSHPGCLCSVCR